MAIQALAEYVKSINYEKDDAAIFGPEGFVANAKVFLDENDQYIDNVQEVLANKEKAEEILPTQEGFFFGSTEYDEYLFEDIERTIEIIDYCLGLPEGYYFEYCSSW